MALIELRHFLWVFWDLKPKKKEGTFPAVSFPSLQDGCMFAEILLQENIFHEVAKYLSFRDFLSLQGACRQTNLHFNKEIKDGWIVKSMQQYFRTYLPEIGFDLALEAARGGNCILSGSALIHWINLEDTLNTTLSACSIGKRSTEIFRKLGSRYKPLDAEAFQVEHSCSYTDKLSEYTTTVVHRSYHQVLDQKPLLNFTKVERADIAGHIAKYLSVDTLIMFDGHALVWGYPANSKKKRKKTQ